MYEAMTEDQKEKAHIKAMRTLHRAQDSYEKLNKALFSSQEDPLSTNPDQLNSNDGDHENQGTDTQDDEQQEEASFKQILRWWKHCLELVETLIRDSCGMAFENVRNFLLEFNRNQQMIQNQVDVLSQESHILSVIDACEKKHARLLETMDRKSKLAIKAKHNLDEEMQNLEEFKTDTRVQEFLMKVSDTIARYEISFKDELGEQKIKHDKKLQKIQQMKITFDHETSKLNKKLDIYIKKAEQDCNNEIKKLKMNHT
eukprot:TRINITY_DN1268_c0_g1_i2.p1 TRINITY_DN1268_c0_g1~~TRINITY_DN1268_c0_g1_i2.p1  ORF type:complete len:257 (+),score=42.42 TRINITY_DN1268_c0_g1_i2:165-935(+)